MSGNQYNPRQHRGGGRPAIRIENAETGAVQTVRSRSDQLSIARIVERATDIQGLGTTHLIVPQTVFVEMQLVVSAGQTAREVRSENRDLTRRVLRWLGKDAGEHL